jgi:magnesium transporter
MRYADNSVGSIMEFEVITVRPEATLAAVQRYLRRLGKMPENTDKLFVTTRNKLLLGELELQTILLNDAQKRVGGDGGRSGHLSAARRGGEGGAHLRT